MEKSELSRFLRIYSIADEYYNRDMSMIIGEIISAYSESRECKAENYEPIYDKKEIEEILKPTIYHLKAIAAIIKAQEHLADFRRGKIAGVLV